MLKMFQIGLAHFHCPIFVYLTKEARDKLGCSL